MECTLKLLQLTLQPEFASAHTRVETIPLEEKTLGEIVHFVVSS
jgi:hypothetical protein